MAVDPDPVAASTGSSRLKCPVAITWSPRRSSYRYSGIDAHAPRTTPVSRSPRRDACFAQEDASCCSSTYASPLLPVRLVQRLPEPLAVRFAADHLTREPLDYLSVEGFEIERLERSKLGIVERVSARKPATALNG